MATKTKAKKAETKKPVAKKSIAKKPVKTKEAKKPVKSVKAAEQPKTAAKKPAPAAKPKAETKKQTIEDKIKAAQKKDMLLIGTKTVIKALKNGKVANVFHAVNMPENTMKDLEHYTKVSGIEVSKFSGDSAKLGEFCGKPFKILLTAVKK
jgi:ribosomal protein L30E